MSDGGTLSFFAKVGKWPSRGIGFKQKNRPAGRIKDRGTAEAVDRGRRAASRRGGGGRASADLRAAAAPDRLPSFHPR